MKITFAGEATEKRIDNFLIKMTPTCDGCGDKKRYFCIEKCCMFQLPFICPQCDRQHTFHRKNQLRLLFLNWSHLQPFSLIMKQKINGLCDIVLQQKQKSQKIVAAQLELIEHCQKTFESLKNSLPKDNEEWLENAYEIAKNNIFLPYVQKSIHDEFQKVMKNINLYVINPIINLKQLHNLKKLLQDFSTDDSKLQNQQEIRSFVKVINESTNNEFQCTEKLILQTNIQKYIQYGENNLKSAITNGINRSKFVKNRSINPEELEASRLLVSFDFSKQRYQCILGNYISQLHTLLQIQSLPNRLESLSYWAWGYDKNKKPKQMTEFPSTIKKLKVIQSDDLTRKVPYNFDRLKNIQYLVIIDGQISDLNIKKLIKFAISNNLRMLSILQGPRKKISLKAIDFDTRDQIFLTHKIPRLEKHYLVYKRKILQLILFERTRFLRKSYGAEDIINYANCKLEEQIQASFSEI